MSKVFIGFGICNILNNGSKKNNHNIYAVHLDTYLNLMYFRYILGLQNVSRPFSM